MEHQQVSEKWIKASILGTIWASSEIVLGSFLHNLRVPFSGNILTAIGLVILISASYQWKEKGLFWRAGIICALLKTMSPSAVIFGPMVAIVSEAVLLELSVRILGRTIPGFLLGAILAMSWNLFQKIFNFIIFYGYNIVEVYTNLMQYAQRQLNLQFDAVWTPLFLLLTVYALLGAVSAWIGIKTGRRLVASPALSTDISSNQTNQKFQKKKDLDFDYSILWLIMNVLFLTGVFLLLGKINFAPWAILVAVVATTWAVRYKRALRQLIKPSLWIFFVLITMVTAFVFTRLQSDSLTFADALLIGVEMNLRAIILIMGFSVLGTELYHPAIREFLAKSYFKQLPPALELSLESLPSMISAVPDLKTILKNPVQVIHHLMAHAEMRIAEIRQRFENTPCVFIITGNIGSGKTTCIKNLVTKLKNKNLSVGGFYSLRIIDNGITTGYNIVNISTGEEQPFLRLDGYESQEKIGRFFIYPEGLKLGKEALRSHSIAHSKLIIMDEIGKLELQGGGWAETLRHFTRLSKCPVLLSVRKEVVYHVIQKWNLNPHFIFEISENNCEEFYDLLIQHLSQTPVQP